MVATFALLAIVSSVIETRDSSRLKIVDQFLTNLSGFGYSGVVLMQSHGKTIFFKGYGLAERRKKIPIGPQTIFDIGSLAKPVTATVILNLEQQGKLSLDGPISNFLPDVPADKAEITVRQLLSHTAGLDEDFPFKEPWSPYEEVDRDSAVRRILELPLVGNPGMQYQYSNGGYVLLAAIAERVTGIPFRDLVESSIFRPANMTSSGFWGSKLPQVAPNLFARSYDENGETGNLEKRSSTTWFDLGGGEMVSTAADLSRFMSALLDGRLLPEEKRADMFRPVLGNYGLGWFLRDERGERIIEHGGDYLGFGSYLAWYPAKAFLFVDLANANHNTLGTHHVVDRICPQILAGKSQLAMFKGERFSPPPRSNPVDSSQCKRLLGRYRCGGATITIRKKGDQLLIGGFGQHAINLLLDNDEKEADTALRLTRRTAAIFDEARNGRFLVLANSLAPQKLDGYRRGITRAVGPDEALGTLVRIMPIGTAPAAFPHGSFNSVLEMRRTKGSEYLALQWLNGRILNIHGCSDGAAYEAILRSSPASGLVGWSIDTFRGFKVTSSGKALRIICGGKTVTAMRE